MASRSEAASGTTPGARRRRRWRRCAGSSTGSTRWSRATSPLRCGGRWGFSGSPAGAALRAPVPNGMAKRALVAPGSPLWRLACLAKAQDCVDSSVDWLTAAPADDSGGASPRRPGAAERLGAGMPDCCASPIQLHGTRDGLGLVSLSQSTKPRAQSRL